MGAWIVLGLIYEYWYIIIPLFVLWLRHKFRTIYYKQTGFYSRREQEQALRNMGYDI